MYNNNNNDNNYNNNFLQCNWLFLRSSLGLQELNSNNINEFFEAIQNAESLGLYSEMLTLCILFIMRS